MTATDASAPADGGLSIDEAVEMLTPRRDDDGFDASLAETEDGDEAAFDEGDTPDDEEGEGGYDPPHFWSAEDKAAFAELPPHLQETVLAYERNRDTAAARAIQAAAEARNRAEAAASGADEVVSRLDKLLPEAEAAFGQRWPDDMDWGALADEVGAEQAMRMKLQRDTEAEALQRMRSARQEAEAASFQSYIASEFEKLKEIAPDLADPRHGAERRQDVVKFLADNGVPLETIRGAGATEFALAYDALRYRKAKASYAQGARPSSSARLAVQPGAGTGLGSSHRRQAGVKARFAQKPSLDNAVAAILARG